MTNLVQKMVDRLAAISAGFHCVSECFIRDDHSIRVFYDLTNVFRFDGGSD